MPYNALSAWPTKQFVMPVPRSIELLPASHFLGGAWPVPTCGAKCLAGKLRTDHHLAIKVRKLDGYDGSAGFSILKISQNLSLNLNLNLPAFAKPKLIRSLPNYGSCICGYILTSKKHRCFHRARSSTLRMLRCREENPRHCCPPWKWEAHRQQMGRSLGKRTDWRFFTHHRYPGTG